MTLTLSSSALLSGVPPRHLQTSGPPKGEDQPQDLTSDVFVYGRPNPDGSDNTPPMSIINFNDLLGRTFLLPMDENGERKRVTISEHVKDLCQRQVSREDQLRFKLKIDGHPLDDLISYNQLMEYLEDKTDTGPLENGLNRFKCIKDHKGPYTSSDPEYNGSSYNLLIEWEPGEHVLETSSAPTTLVERDKLDLSSLIPPKGKMESSFSWTCPFKHPTSSTLCLGEPTLGKLNQETDSYMTKHMPKPSSGANRVSVSHSILVTKNGSISMGRTSYMIFPSHGSTSRRLTGETNSSSTTLHMDTCSWKLTGEAHSTTPHVDILWLAGKVMKHTLLDTRPQKLIGVVMTLTLTM